MNKAKPFLERETELFIEVKRKVKELAKSLERETKDIEKFVAELRNLCSEMLRNKICSKLDRTCSWCKLDRVCDELERVSYCLLYTSPSPRDLSTSRMPSSA